jgi:mercuric ion transport protein
VGERLARGASLGGAVAAAFAASACCVGPLLFALLGLGGAGALVALEPYRLPLLGLTAALLGLGWWLELRAGPASDPCDCARPRARRTGRGALWAGTGVVIALVASPSLAPLLLGWFG